MMGFAKKTKRNYVLVPLSNLVGTKIYLLRSALMVNLHSHQIFFSTDRSPNFLGPYCVNYVDIKEDICMHYSKFFMVVAKPRN